MSAQKEPKKPSARAKAPSAPQIQPQEYDPEIERELWDVLSKAWKMTYERHQREREAEVKLEAERLKSEVKAQA